MIIYNLPGMLISALCAALAWRLTRELSLGDHEMVALWTAFCGIAACFYDRVPRGAAESAYMHSLSFQEVEARIAYFGVPLIGMGPALFVLGALRPLFTELPLPEIRYFLLVGASCFLVLGVAAWTRELREPEDHPVPGQASRNW